MKTIYLEVESKRVKQQQKISSKHFWFDTSSGEMQVVSGGRLRFKYDFLQKKMIPYSEERNIPIICNADNKTILLNWIKDNKTLVSVNDGESAPGIIAIDIEDSDVEHVTNLLDRCGFRYN